MASDRTALGTGGRRGIGFGIAMALAAEGYAVGVCGLRTADQVTT